MSRIAELDVIICIIMVIKLSWIAYWYRDTNGRKGTLGFYFVALLSFATQDLFSCDLIM